MAKSDNALSVGENLENVVSISVANKKLSYSLNSETIVNSIKIFDLSGRELIDNLDVAQQGAISLNGLSSGVHVVVFTIDGKGVTSQKFVVE